MDRRNFIKFGILVTSICGLEGCNIINPETNPEISEITNYNYKKVNAPCSMPFEYFEINTEGRVFPCCAHYVKHRVFGNIYKQDLLSIWTGKDYEELRNKVLNGDFSLCNRNICCYNPSEYTKDFNPSEQMPKSFFLCYDQECNYKCITCRDEIYQNTEEELNRLNNDVWKDIIPFIKKLNDITFSGGDPLASRHSRKLIKEVCKTCPDINITINTQGYFLDENNMKELGIKKLQRTAISIHSATRKTYEKIMRQDSFNRIMKNLEFISNWKKQGLVKEVALNFVVHSMNYKEMPAFVKLAEKFDADAIFWTYKPWPSAEMHKRYKEVAVFETWHKDYPKLQKILKDPVFRSEHCYLYPDLLKIANS